MEQSVPKRRHIKIRRRVITQKKGYNKSDSENFISLIVRNETSNTNIINTIYTVLFMNFILLA